MLGVLNKLFSCPELPKRPKQKNSCSKLWLRIELRSEGYCNQKFMFLVCIWLFNTAEIQTPLIIFLKFILGFNRRIIRWRCNLISLQTQYNLHYILGQLRFPLALKVSKFVKQIFLFSFEPKNDLNHSLISALASKNGLNKKIISFVFWFKWEQENLLYKFTDL